jgi:1-acyl-sn-glycerol-3-phosphate acyltransferase
MNHSAWWDAVVPVHLSHNIFRREIHALMEAEQIRRYPFFRHIGCFGPTDSSITEARAVIEYSVRALERSKAAVLWICPQGALLPSHIPLRFKSGLARIAREVPGALVVPVAFRYVFLKKAKPDCRVRIGEPVERAEETAPQLTRRLESRLQAELDLLDAEIAAEITPG